MQTFTRMPTQVEAVQFDGVHHPDVVYNSGTQQHYYGAYPVDAGDWLIKTPTGCKCVVKEDAFDRLFNGLRSGVDGMRLLTQAIHALLDAGLHITGIDPAQVQILTREQYLEQAEPRPIAELTPSGPVPNTPAGYSGDLSPCCGAMQTQRGTCKYCLDCGKGDGCS